jgi:hypothetical protein
MKQKIDKFLSSWVSKKLMVFVVTTALTMYGRVNSADFVDIAMVYIATQGAVDIVRRLRNNSL